MHQAISLQLKSLSQGMFQNLERRSPRRIDDVIFSAGVCDESSSDFAPLTSLVAYIVLPLKELIFFLLQYQHVSPTRSHRPPPIHHVNSFRISVPQYPPCQANQENGGTNVVGLMGRVKQKWSSAVRGYKSFFH